MNAVRAPRVLVGPGTRDAMRDYSQGLVALIPALVLLVTIRAFGESAAWGSRQVLVMALGMTASVLTTTGFVQAVNRRASICFGLGDVPSATRFLRNALIVAEICVVSFGCLVVLVVSELGVFTVGEILTFGVAFLGLSAIWLLSAGLSLMRASVWFGMALAAGLIVGVALHWALERAPIVQLTVATAVGFSTTIGVLGWSTRRAVRRMSTTVRRRVALPPAGYLLSEATPYFVHGALYALLFFIPHVFAWLAILRGSEPRLWSIVSFEAGMTLAMPPLILAGGMAEHTLQQFWQRAAIVQTSTPAEDSRQFEITLRAFYRRQLLKYLLLLGGLTVVAGLLYRWSLNAGILAAWLGLDRLDLVQTVLVAGLLAYGLCGWGLFNCMFALSLARPQFAVQAVFSGVAATVVVGAGLTVFGGTGTGYALLSAILGSAVYVVASSVTTARLFDAMHYYYSTAF
jgi:hypothetical protein